MHTKRPNALLLFPDQWRPDWMPWNPDLPLRLPNLAALAARGMRFLNAVSPSPICAPARACLAMGVEFDHCPVKSNNDSLPLEEETVYEKLRAAGYHVLGCGKFDLAKPDKDWGAAGDHPLPDGRRRLREWGFTRGVDNSGKYDGYKQALKGNYCPYTGFLREQQLLDVHLEDFKQRRAGHPYFSTFPTALPDFAYADNFIAERGLELLRDTPAGEPWFLQVNFNGPHDPVDVTFEMWKRWQGTDFPGPSAAGAEADGEKHTAARQNYASMLENIDGWVGALLGEIERRGELENTLVIFASDHGEMLGDHGRWGKAVPYQASVGVPLVVAGPGVQGGTVNESPVSLIDVAATIGDRTGAMAPRLKSGRSLGKVLEGKEERVREVALSGYERWRVAFDGRWKLVRGFDETLERARQSESKNPEAELLFDLRKDPKEERNLAGSYPEVVARLRSYLERSEICPGQEIGTP